MGRYREYLLPASLFTLAIALVLLVLVPSVSADTQDQGLGIGTKVVLTQEHLAGVRLAWAFVETGSESPLVLCTFNENSPGFGAVRLTGLTLFCRQRTVELEEGPVYGVGIVAFLPGTFQPPQGFELQITVFHEGAAFYGELLPCPGDC